MEAPVGDQYLTDKRDWFSPRGFGKFYLMKAVKLLFYSLLLTQVVHASYIHRSTKFNSFLNNTTQYDELATL